MNENALPSFFNSWSKVASGDLLRELPDEDNADLGSNPHSTLAADEFRRLVRDALLSEVVLGDTIGNDGLTRTERRSLIDRCHKFAKAGPWRSIRSKRIWCKTVMKPNAELVWKVALRVELFAQLRADRRLCEMGQNTFKRRAQRYGVGTSTRCDRPEGQAAVVLTDAFVADLLSGLDDDEPDDEVGDTIRFAHCWRPSSPLLKTGYLVGPEDDHENHNVMKRFHELREKQPPPRAKREAVKA